LQWFKSYLSDRKKFVVMGDCKSEVGVVLSGVPQVSVLGPLLITYKYLLFFHLANFKNTWFNFHFYADDTHLYMFKT